MSVEQPVGERMRSIRWRMARERTSFSKELRLIPRSAFVVLIVLFLLAEVVAQLVNAQLRQTPGEEALPPLLLLGAVTGAGIVLGALILLWVYVYRDAARRGMHPVFWTLLAIFIPYLLGAIIYFLMREPLPFNCPQCGTALSARFNFCPRCKYSLHPACPECKREVRADDRFCPNCGRDLAGAEIKTG